MANDKKEKLIKITLNNDVKVDEVWKKAGSIIDMEAGEANRLIRLKAAVNFDADEAEASEVNQDTIDLISSIEGVSDKTAKALIEAGFDTVQKIAEAEPDDLIAVPGVGNKSVEVMQDSADAME